MDKAALRLVFCTTLFLGVMLVAAGQSFQVMPLPVPDSISSPVHDVDEDDYGFVWLATADGLLKYDGRNFSRETRANYSGISLLDDAELVTWNNETMTFHGHGLEPDNDRFQVAKNMDLKNDPVIDVVPADEGQALWILSENRLVVIEKGVMYVPALPGHEGNLRNCVISVQNNKVFVLTAAGFVYQWNNTRREFSKSTLNTRFVKPQAHVVVHDSLQFIVDQARIFEVAGDGKVMRPRFSGFPEEAEVTSLRYWNGYLLAGTAGDGIWLGNPGPAGFSFTRVMNGNEPHRVAPLPFVEVSKMVTSSHGHLWVVSGKQVWLLKQRPFRRFSADVPNSSFEQTVFLSNGYVYLDSENGLVECYRKRNNEYRGRLNTLGISRQSAIGGRDNRLWIATVEGNLYLYENQKVKRVTSLADRGGIIFHLFADSKGALWVSQAPDTKPIVGILKVTPDLTRVEYGSDKGIKTRMLVVKEAPDGVLYAAGIGEDSYLYRYDSLRDSFVNLSVKMNFDYGENFEVHDIAIDAEHTVWLASTAGLLRFSKGHVEKIYAEEIYDTEAVGVTIASDGAVWFGTDSRGVVRYTHGNFTFYDLKAGLASRFVTYRSMVATPDGLVWAGTREGIFLSSPADHAERTTRMPVMLDVVSGNRTSMGASPFAYNSTIRFDFISPTHPANTVQYAYSLGDHNNAGWINLAPHDSLVLTALKAGNYHLRIRARQAGGYSWSEPLVYPFTVDRVWYLKTEAFIIYGLLTVLAILTGVRRYNKYLRIEKQNLEKKVAERTSEIAYKNEEIMAQNEEITTQMEEISTHMEELRKMNEEMAAQRDYSDRQRDLIEQQNRALADAKAGLEEKVKERTAELYQSHQELLEHNIQLEQFAFMTAHNLRGPVARLIGLSTIFNAADAADPINREVIARIQEASRQLDEIISDISTILHVKKSLGEKMEAIKVQTVLQKVIHAFRQDLTSRNIVVANMVEPYITIHGIEPYVYSVFYNIISNSIKYADVRKAPRITIESANHNDKIQLVFSDNGIGFDVVGHREKLFKPFSRLNASVDGKGLGLYLLKIEMESMHGAVEIQSTPDLGTKVILSFCRN